MKTITLTQPITRGDSTIDTITLTEPKAGHLRGLSLADVVKMDTDAMLKLIPRLSTPSLVEHEIGDMNVADYTALATEVIGFFVPTAA